MQASKDGNFFFSYMAGGYMDVPYLISYRSINFFVWCTTLYG